VKPRSLLLTVALVAVPSTALAQIPVGTRVGGPIVSGGYEDGGRPDPFTSLVTPKRAVNPQPGAPAARTDRLGTISVAEVRCTGVMRQGAKYASAILEGPNHLSYVVKVQDRLLDGVVKSIDALGVTLIEHTTDVSGAVEGREIKKLLHPAAEVK
jgi:Tfp pilus assembly protein PilP